MKNEMSQDFNYDEFQELIDDIQKDAPHYEAMKEENETPTTDKGKKKKRIKRHRIGWYTYFLIVVDICALICFYVFYGPSETVRDWFITTAITTGRHKYLAYILYDSKTISSVLSNNNFVSVEGSTDASKIQFVENPDTGYYRNDYDKQIVQHDEGQTYKIINFDEDGTKGYIAVIYKPENVNLVLSTTGYGNTMTQFGADAKVAINAGGHYLYEDHTISPMGSVVTDGKIRHNSYTYEPLVCMTNDNVLLLKWGRINDVIKNDIRWAVHWSPFLIVNGVSAQYTGNGGLGVRPRTAIGQREDGIILFVVIDGNSGASMPQLVKIFERYFCVNAANLDGGGSSMMTVNGEIINHPAGWGYSGERYVIDAIVYK